MSDANTATRRLLTVDEVGERLGLSKHTIYRLIWSKELPAIRLGGAGASLRIDEAALEQWLRDHGTR